MDIDPQKIGIIAGGGQFPLLFVEAAKKKGRTVVMVAHKGETSPEVAEAADHVCWVKLGQLGKITKFFKNKGVGEAVFLGFITKTQIFRNILPDFKGLTLWNKVDSRQDDALLRAVANVLEEDGIKILESTMYLQHLLFPKGVLTKKKPSKKQMQDISFGWQNAKAIGKLDIGQCVVVRNRNVLAVEAIDGTDATIKRGGKLAKEKAVVVKVQKPGQDARFDLPATGLTTISSMKRVKASILAVETGKALLFDRDEVIETANEAGIIVVGIEEDSEGKLHY
jgi:UDP-2,3-diacylglucosamine hydrolase